MDVFIPRDRRSNFRPSEKLGFLVLVILLVLNQFFFLFMLFRTGDSRGFAFVRYKYKDEAHKAVERLDGKLIKIFFLYFWSVISVCGIGDWVLT